MNAIQTIVQAPSPHAEKNQLNAANGDSAVAAGLSQAFAAVMGNASPKPVKKGAPNLTADTVAAGNPAPATGNAVPPLTVGLPQAVTVLSVAAPAGAVVTSALASTKAVAVPVTQTTGLVGGVAAPQAAPPATTESIAAGSVLNAGPSPAVAAQAVPASRTVVLGKPIDRPMAAKLPVGSSTGNARPTVASAAAITGHESATAVDATGTAAPSDPTSAAAIASSSVTVAGAGTVAMASTASNVAAPATPATGTFANASPTPESGPDASTATAATTANAAASAGTARVMVEVASTIVADKHSRGDADLKSISVSTTTDGTANLAQAMPGPASTSTTEAAGSPTFKIGASVDSGEFGQGVANQVATMVGDKINSAKLSVNPPALGPIEVRIAVQGDHAQVWLVSHSAVTRDALQASTSKLRDMLGDQGFGQVSVDISQRSFQDRTPTGQGYQWKSGSERNDYPAAVSVAGAVARAASGALDAYA